MLFMVIENFRNQDAKSVYRRFLDKGRQMPDGIAFVGSWTAADLGRCFQIMEADDVTMPSAAPPRSWRGRTAPEQPLSCPPAC